MISSALQKVFLDIQRHADKLKLPVYLIGGCVRDMLLDRPITDADCDLVVEGVAVVLAKALVDDWRQQGFDIQLQEFSQFGTVKLTGLSSLGILDELDIASTRIEEYASSGALPVVKLGATLAQDVRRRDFTINTLALPLSAFEQSSLILKNSVVDSVGGLADLEQRVLKILHQESFIDDPTRLFRGCRYQVKIKGRFDVLTSQAARSALAAKVLGEISHQRQFRELELSLEIDEHLLCLEALADLGVLAHLWFIQDAQEVVRKYRSSVLNKECDLDQRIAALLSAAEITHQKEKALAFFQGLQVSKKRRTRIIECAEAMK